MRTLIVSILALIWLNHAQASMVLPTTLNQVVQHAELVFEGRVVSKQTRRSANNQPPFTYFTFVVLDVLKGTYTPKTIELGFMGGSINGRTIHVTDMLLPELNETGIYFVESLSRQQVHPFYGWHQGHYLIVPLGAGQAARVMPKLMPNTASSPFGKPSLLMAPTVETFKQGLRQQLGTAQ